MRELLKNKCAESNGPFSWSVFIRERTFDAMFRIWKECSAVEESTGYDMHNNTILLLHRHYCFLSLYTSFICKISFLCRGANALLCTITRGNTATKLISDESDDKNPSEKELVNKDNLLQRNKINQNTKVWASNWLLPQISRYIMFHL